MTEQTKVCTKCGVEKSLEEFASYNSKGRAPGARRAQCRACQREYDASKNAAPPGFIRVGCLNPETCPAKGNSVCLPCARRNPEWRAGQAERSRVRMTQPTNMAKSAEHMRQMWGDPVFRENMKHMMEDQQRDPAFAAKSQAAVQTYHERRRENEAYEVFMARMEAEDADFDQES